MGGWREKGRRPKRARTRPAQDSPQDRAQDFRSPSLEPGPGSGLLRSSCICYQPYFLCWAAGPRNRLPTLPPQIRKNKVLRTRPRTRPVVQDLQKYPYKTRTRPSHKTPSESCAHKAGLVRTRNLFSVKYSNNSACESHGLHPSYLITKITTMCLVRLRLMAYILHILIRKMA